MPNTPVTIATGAFEEFAAVEMTDREDPRPDLTAQSHTIVKQVWDKVENLGGRPAEMMRTNPGEFGECLAYRVFGVNAAFTESEIFYKAGVDDALNGAAEELGYTGYGCVAETRDGWVIEPALYK